MKFFLLVALVLIPVLLKAFTSFLPLQNSQKTRLQSSLINSDEVLAEYKQELISLRGTPELVDRLENLASKYPGLEVHTYIIHTLFIILMK